MELNLTTTSYQDLNPMMLQDYVTVDQCKNYVASTTRANYILMSLLILLGIAILLWINKEKIKRYFIKKGASKIGEQLKMFSDAEALEKLGADFMNKPNDIHAPSKGASGEGGDDDNWNINKFEEAINGESRDKNIHSNTEERSNVHREDEQHR